jgi:hypothetical protein
MSTSRPARGTIPMKASEPFLARILGAIVQFFRYLFGLFFNFAPIVTDT